jgi:cardiolipin-specific phospholipase
MSAITVPTRFLYGSKDWMDPLGGHMAVENMKKAGNDRSKVSIVNEAGHHVYLDNPERMNEIFFEELAPRSSSSRR